jgi:hypothetical protein
VLGAYAAGRRRPKIWPVFAGLAATGLVYMIMWALAAGEFSTVILPLVLLVASILNWRQWWIERAPAGAVQCPDEWCRYGIHSPGCQYEDAA